MKSLRRLFTAATLPILMSFIIVGCSGPIKTPTKTLTSIAVTPASPAHLKVGATQQFTATGTYSDSSTADISATVTWASGTTATATITASGGLATGVAQGTTQITASMGTVTSPGVTLTVISLTSIAVTPNPASVAVSLTVQLTATGTYSDASTADISSQVTWACAPSTVATISASGLATAGAANATCQITATLGAIVSPGVTLTVGTGGVPVPVAVQIVQVNPTIAVGGVEDFTAKFKMSDGTLVAPTAAVTWTSGSTAMATILASSGIASGVGAGTSTITAASAGLTSGTTLLTVVPAVSRFAYVSGLNDVGTASYVVNAANTTLTPFGVLRDATNAQIVPEPSGRFAYGIGADNFGDISIYNVDATTGVLTKSGNTFSAGVSSPGPFQAIVDATGRFLYVVNSSTNNVSAMQINSVDGTLSCLGGPPAPAPPCAATLVGSFPVGLAEDRLGKFLYVSNNGDNNVSGFSVGPDGSLAPLSTATFPTGAGPGLPAIDSTGSFLFVPNSGDNTISVFSIGPAGPLAGLLTPVTGSPFSLGVGSGPTMAVVDPAGKFLYVTSENDNTVSTFAITAGALGTGTSTPTGNFPFGLAIDPAGAFLIVVNQTDNTLTYYAVNSTTGALTARRTVQTRSIPQLVNLYAGIAAPVIAPATVEAANSGTVNDISSYTVNAGTGALTAAATSPTTGIAGNGQVAASQTGRFFYTASASVPKFAGFSVDASAGLTALSATPVGLTDLTGHVPAGIYAEPSDQFFYIGDTTTSAIIAFNNGASSMTSNSTLSGAGSVNSIAGDPQGSLIFALGAAQIQPTRVDSSAGSLALGNVLSIAGTNWTAGAVDASGLFLVAADSMANSLQSFQIVPVSSSASDGNLTAGPTAATGSTGPYAVTFDPLNRFVFLADLAAGTVKTFAFNSTTGVLTAGSTTTAVANGVTNVAVDANGKFLYVGLPGSTTSNPSSVAVYSIDATTGVLTAVGAPIASGTKTAGVTVTNSVN